MDNVETLPMDVSETQIATVTANTIAIEKDSSLFQLGSI